MLLSARMLQDVASVNVYEYVDQVEWTQGDVINVYFQLVDAAKDRTAQAFKISGRRYMPTSGATLSVTLTNIDSAVSITRAAVQPFPTSDPSIWYVALLASDTISGTVGMKLQLTETGPKITRGSLAVAARVQPQVNI